MRVRDARPDDVPALARVHVASWHDTYRGIIPRSALPTYGRAVARFMRGPQRGTSLLVVEDAHGEVFGYATAGPQRDRSLPFLGEVYELYLHPDSQGRGGGRLLLTSAIWRLVDRGLNPVLVWVLEQNSARRFYESLGAVACARRAVALGGGVSAFKLGYGWHEALPLPV